MAATKLVGGIATAALVLGLLSGCDEGGANGDDRMTPSSSSSASAAPLPGDEPGSGAGGEVQSKIEELLDGAPIGFEPESSELDAESKATLKQIAEAAAAEDVKLSVVTRSGYPNPDKALELSQERADSIKAELVANGMADDAVETEPLGNEKSSAGDYAVEIAVV